MKNATYKTWYCGACRGIFATTQMQSSRRDNLYLAAVLINVEQAKFALPLQRFQYVICNRIVDYNVRLTRTGPEPATSQEYQDALHALEDFSDDEEAFPAPPEFEFRQGRATRHLSHGRTARTDLDMRFAMRCDSYDFSRPVVPYLDGFEVNDEWSDYIVLGTGESLWWFH
jgi:hypothetical protein